MSLQTLSHYHSQLHLLDDDLALSHLDHLLTDLLAAEELRCSGDYAEDEDEVCGAALGQLGGYARVLEKVLPMQVEAKDDKVLVEVRTEAVRVQVSR